MVTSGALTALKVLTCLITGWHVAAAGSYVPAALAGDAGAKLMTSASPAMTELRQRGRQILMFGMPPPVWWLHKAPPQL
jgi:hypothetical protein